MSCFVLIIITIFFFTICISSNANIEIITQVCKASRDPLTCRDLLIKSTPSNATTVSQAVQSALFVSWHNLNTGVSMFQDIRDAASAHNNNNNKTRSAAERCLEVLGYSQHRMGQAAAAFDDRRPNDARAWLSAVLAHEYGCLSGKMNDTLLPVSKAVDFFNSSLIPSTADALGMVANYDDHGIDTASWAPTKTERDGYWPPKNRTRSGSMPPGVPSGLNANVTVCKSGCDYGTVQAAVRDINCNSSRRFVIWIKAGVYDETVLVPFETRNVVFLGDGMGKTVITGSKNVGIQGLNTYKTATLSVLGDGFMATGITVENTAGYGANQAVAFLSESDLSVVEGCEFLGNQDTLYASSLRQYYKSCRIQGNVDFIFGGSAAIFEDCLIFIAPRQVEKGEGKEGESNTVTAHARKDPAQSTGFVFRNCVVNGTDAYMRLYYNKNYLGRPWKEYSRTVFIECRLEALISAQGWTNWDEGFALDTLYYGEYGNTGPGANTSMRANFSSIIPAKHVNSYSIQNFFG